MYNYVIVGAGLMGSAAGRHLAEMSEGVALVGPAEPENWSTHDGVFSSHYDQGRLATYYGPDEIWNVLDQASIDNYVALEQKSGVHFYEPAGLVSIVPEGEERYAYRSGLTSIKKYTAADFPAEIPLVIPAGFDAFLESAPSGYINPREMALAQVTAAKQAGATLIDQQIVSLSQQAGFVELGTRDGQTIRAKKVMVATGAFTNAHGLLPRKIALRVKPETTILAEVTAAEAERLQSVPPLNVRMANSEINNPYLVPPVCYPDGRYYLKMGCDTPSDRLFTTLDEMKEWFRHGDTDKHLGAMQAQVMSLFPDLNVTSWHTKPCIVCYTPSGKPFIDALDEQLYVLTGGNGTGAHPADALGKLAADLMHSGKWQSELGHAPFQLQYADDWQEWLVAPLTDHFS